MFTKITLMLLFLTYWLILISFNSSKVGLSLKLMLHKKNLIGQTLHKFLWLK